MQSVSIIGIGRLGGALALALSRAGYYVKELIFRSDPGPLQIAAAISPGPNLIRFEGIRQLTADVIFITSPDPEISIIASQLVPLINGSHSVFHCSGSLNSDVLGPLRAKRCETGSIHPLLSISDPIRGSEGFSGSFFCVEGSEKAVILANAIVADLGGEAFSIDTRFKGLYHASAVTASGHLTALIDVSLEMLAKCGVSRDVAERILMPLVVSTVDNLQEQGASEALTGTYARADTAAFQRHLNALKSSSSSDVTRLFLELALRSTRLAEGKAGRLSDFQNMAEAIRIALETVK